MATFRKDIQVNISSQEEKFSPSSKLKFQKRPATAYNLSSLQQFVSTPQSKLHFNQNNLAFHTPIQSPNNFSYSSQQKLLVKKQKRNDLVMSSLSEMKMSARKQIIQSINATQFSSNFLMKRSQSKQSPEKLELKYSQYEKFKKMQENLEKAKNYIQVELPKNFSNKLVNQRTKAKIEIQMNKIKNDRIKRGDVVKYLTQIKKNQNDLAKPFYKSTQGFSNQNSPVRNGRQLTLTHEQQINYTDLHQQLNINVPLMNELFIEWEMNELLQKYDYNETKIPLDKLEAYKQYQKSKENQKQTINKEVDNQQELSISNFNINSSIKDDQSELTSLKSSQNSLRKKKLLSVKSSTKFSNYSTKKRILEQKLKEIKMFSRLKNFQNQLDQINSKITNLTNLSQTPKKNAKITN